MEPAITVRDPEHLGDLLKGVVDRLENRPPKPTFAFAIPYSYKTSVTEINEVYQTCVSAPTFEEAEQIALNQLSSQILEWIRCGLTSYVHVDYTPKT